MKIDFSSFFYPSTAEVLYLFRKAWDESTRLPNF